MRTIETPLYSFNELNSDAQDKVISRIAENQELDYSDIQASLKAVCEALNLRLLDWSYGPYCQNYEIKVSGNAEDLKGNKALAYVLRKLMENGYSRPKKFADMQFPGVCGFTGVCYDETIVESLWKSLLEGKTIYHAFDRVAYALCQSCESELDYQQSRECILEYLDTEEEIYTEEGEEF